MFRADININPYQQLLGLDISGNNLRNIPSTIGALKPLTRLMTKNNPLAELSDDVESALGDLESDGCYIER